MSDQLKIGPEFIWKNFHLGTELEVAGNFLYDGLYIFDQMKFLYVEADIFNCLYYLCVGVERLQKITLILLTKFGDTKNPEFEKKLVSHSLQHLHERINKVKTVKFGKNENKLLTLLTRFYEKNRYGRFNFDSSQESEYEKKEFIRFLSDLMRGNDIEVDPRTVMTINNDTFKKEFGKTVRNIVLSYYQIIEQTCRSQNIYTYEVNQDSKACQIFLGHQFDFIHTKHIKREALYYLMKNFNKLISNKKMEAIDFDPDSIQEMVDFLMNSCKSTHVIDTYECIIHDQMQEKLDLSKAKENRQLYLEYLFN